MRNLQTRNYNLGNRDMTLALKNAVREKGSSEKTIKDYESHIRKFINFTKIQRENSELDNLKTLNQLERADVEKWAEHLNQRWEEGTLKNGAANTMLSAINSALKQARQDNLLRVTPVRDAGLPGRKFIATVDKSTSQDVHNKTRSMVPERLGAQLDLQRTLGLRLKESCLINARDVLKQAEPDGIPMSKPVIVKISSGTKGGKSRPVLICTKSQIDALRAAAKIQGSDDSMVPNEKSWSQYQTECYKQLQKTPMNGFHAERHHFANDKYQKLTGVESPVRSGVEHGREHIKFLAEKRNIGYQAAKTIDHNARMQISSDLGHCRVNITNNYLG